MSTITDGNTKAEITEKAMDHGVDALCALGIVGAVALGNSDMTVIGGLVSIALGKRVIGGPKK